MYSSWKLGTRRHRGEAAADVQGRSWVAKGAAPVKEWLEVGGFEGGEEAQRAHGKRDEGWKRGVRPKQGRSVQHGAIPTQCDTEIRDICTGPVALSARQYLTNPRAWVCVTVWVPERSLECRKAPPVDHLTCGR